MTLEIIFCFVLIWATGLFILRRRFVQTEEQLRFASEYRNQFVGFANLFFESYDRFERMGKIDPEKYVWLTKNANKMQVMLGQTGLMEYVGPFQRYKVSGYSIVLNTLPKFRDKSITEFDVNSVDDCLLRYIGIAEELKSEKQKQLKNPILWLKQGFKELFALPIYVVNWFGIIPDRAVGKITSNLFFNILVGIGAFVTFISGLVTIIQGKEQTIGFIKEVFGK